VHPAWIEGTLVKGSAVTTTTRLMRGAVAATMIAAMAPPSLAAPSLPRDLRTMIAMGGTDLEVGCAAYLFHHAAQLPASRRPRDLALGRSLMARVRLALGEDAGSQYLASTFAVLRDNKPAQVAVASGWCARHYVRGVRR
jgi:hypothetical protein